MKKISLFLMTFLSFAAIIHAQPGWQWQHPLLQGNDLNSIIMNGVSGWAVGDMGVVMRTNNSGIDWEIVDLKTSRNLNCIYLEIISGRGWIAGDRGAIFYTEDGGDHWTKQNSHTTEDLYSVVAIGGDCPWACGRNVVLRGLLHGEIWETIYCPFSNHWDMDIIDCNEVWLCGNQGLIISTKDNGVTWQSHSTPTTHNLLSIDVDPNSDYRACGNQSVVIGSSDYGQTWVLENQAPFINFRSVETRGIVGPAYAVGDKGHISETLDGGTTWTEMESPAIYQLNDVCFQALYHSVYAAGWYGQVLKKEEATTAGFEILNKQPTHYFMDVDFINADTGWVVGGERIDDAGNRDGLILHTVDAGKTWETQLNKPVFFSSVDFINENEGWAVGESSVQYAEGVIMHTTNGGHTWISQSNPVIGSVEKVFFIDENNGWVVSSDWWGQIAHTMNGGQTWTLQTNPTKNPIADVFFINPQKGWAVGMDSTILRTINGGQNWIRTELTVSNNWYFRSVFFIDEMNGWVVGVYGVIMLTTDGGITWQQVVPGNGQSLQSVFFIDAMNGWAVGVDGTVIRSIDGGYTWFSQYSGIRRNFLCSVQFTDLKNGWISGEGGTIKHTINGGFWNEPGTYIRNNLVKAIPDNGQVTDTLRVESNGLKDGSYQLTGLEVMIDSVMHARAGDLEITLSHLGVTQTLVSQLPDPGMNILWSRLIDGASVLITNGVAPFSGNYKPFQPLNVFNGLDPDGDWILTIKDKTSGNTGKLHAWGIKPEFEKILSVNDPGSVNPEALRMLGQNIPNPFNAITEISWKVTNPGYVLLKVFDFTGRELETLVDSYQAQGEYTVKFHAGDLQSGVYFYQLRLNGLVETRKMILLK